MVDIPTILDLWTFSDVEGSESRFREWLLKVPETDSYHVELQTQLARTFSLRRQFDQAHAILDEVEPRTTLSPAVEVRYLLERGRTFNSAGQKSEAEQYFHKAWDAGKAAGLDYLAVDAAHMLAIVYPEPEKQIEWLNTALSLAQQSRQEDVGRWFGSLYNNLGWTYYDMREYDNALATLQKAFDWQQNHGKTPNIRIAKYAVGKALRALERYPEALDIQEKLLAEYIAEDSEDGFVSEEIGENLLALERPDEAKPHFRQAYVLLKSISWVEPHRLERLEQLAATE